MIPTDVLERCAGLAAAEAEECEHNRTLPAVVVKAFHAAGLFHLCVPADAGGGESDPQTFVSTIARIARADASAGWSVMVAATAGLMLGFVDSSVAREIFDGGRGILAGVYAPGGRATSVDGGYRVTGRWPFASGCRHATWLMGGALVDGGDAHRIVLFPAADAHILNTWHVAGLRGTGSDDFRVDDAAVPAGRTLSLREPAVAPGPLYAFPPFGLLAAGIAAVTLGIARGAIDDLTELAASKKPSGSSRRLADRTSVQSDVADARALTDAASAYLSRAIDDAWTAAVAGAAIPVASRAKLRLAAAKAVEWSARAVDLMYAAGGGSAVYESSPLQRRFRDVHAATQHMMVASPVVEMAGRALLGLDVDPALL